MQTLAAKMRAARISRGETQEDTARLMGVRYKSYQRWESGTTAPELAAFLVICDYFGWDRPKDLILVPDVDSTDTTTARLLSRAGEPMPWRADDLALAAAL